MKYFHYIDSKETFDLYKDYFGYTGKDPREYPLAICPRISSDSDTVFDFGGVRNLHPLAQ